MLERASLLICASVLATATRASGIPVAKDTLMDQAVVFLNKTLDDLRDIRNRSQAFLSAFSDESARHPCDICRERGSAVDVHRYAFEAEQAYPERFEFTTEIDRDAITYVKFDKYEYRYRIPYTKHIPASPLAQGDGNRQDLAKPYTVKLIAVVKYLNGHFSIENVEGSAPGAAGDPDMLMVELAPMIAIGTPAFNDQAGFTPDVSGTLIKAGIVWYFSPSEDLKQQGVWLKTGLRVAMRTAQLDHGDLEYVRDKVGLTPAYGRQGLIVDPEPTIDIKTRVSGLNETIRSTALELPFGVSKRIPLSRNMDLSLEAEVSYSVVLTNSIDGDYDLDRTGTNHVIAGDTMSASGPTPLAYTHADAAVKEAATGELIEFFTGRTGLLDDLALDKKGFLSFGFLPSVLIRSDGKVKYNIGLRFQMVGNTRTSGTVLGEDYFRNESDNDRPALTTLTSSPYQTYVGLTLGLTL